MKEIKIIALSGHIGSGKDYIANICRDNFGYKHLKLAGLIKYIYCQINGITLEQLEERKYKEIARPQLIAYGEKMKEVDNLCHCKYVYNQIVEDLEIVNPNREINKYVISDLRFPYEHIYFKKLARCSNHLCEDNYIGFPNYEVEYQSLYIKSDLTPKSVIENDSPSESYYESYFSKINEGIIFNGTEERYDRNNERLISQLLKFV